MFWNLLPHTYLWFNYYDDDGDVLSTLLLLHLLLTAAVAATLPEKVLTLPFCFISSHNVVSLHQVTSTTSIFQNRKSTKCTGDVKLLTMAVKQDSRYTTSSSSVVVVPFVVVVVVLTSSILTRLIATNDGLHHETLTIKFHVGLPSFAYSSI